MLSIVEEMYAYILVLHSGLEERGIHQNSKWFYFNFLRHLAATAQPQSSSYFSGVLLILL